MLALRGPAASSSPRTGCWARAALGPRARIPRGMFESKRGIRLRSADVRSVRTLLRIHSTHSASHTHKMGDLKMLLLSHTAPHKVLGSVSCQTATLGRNGIFAPARRAASPSIQPDSDHADPCHRHTPVTRMRRIQVDVWLRPWASRTHPITVGPGLDRAALPATPRAAGAARHRVVARSALAGRPARPSARQRRAARRLLQRPKPAPAAPPAPAARLRPGPGHGW
jgi:hypothetical protein